MEKSFKEKLNENSRIRDSQSRLRNSLNVTNMASSSPNLPFSSSPISPQLSTTPLVNHGSTVSQTHRQFSQMRQSHVSRAHASERTYLLCQGQQNEQTNLENSLMDVDPFNSPGSRNTRQSMTKAELVEALRRRLRNLELSGECAEGNNTNWPSRQSASQDHAFEKLGTRHSHNFDCQECNDSSCIDSANQNFFQRSSTRPPNNFGNRGHNGSRQGHASQEAGARSAHCFDSQRYNDSRPRDSAHQRYFSQRSSYRQLNFNNQENNDTRQGHGESGSRREGVASRGLGTGRPHPFDNQRYNNSSSTDSTNQNYISQISSSRRPNELLNVNRDRKSKKRGGKYLQSRNVRYWKGEFFRLKEQQQATSSAGPNFTFNYFQGQPRR